MEVKVGVKMDITPPQIFHFSQFTFLPFYFFTLLPFFLVHVLQKYKGFGNYSTFNMKKLECSRKYITFAIEIIKYSN